MTRVRIVINDPLLGDVEIEQDDYIGSRNVTRQREAITRLLDLANDKARRAYRLDEAEQ